MGKHLLRIEDIYTLRLWSRHGTDMGGGVLLCWEFKRLRASLLRIEDIFTLRLRSRHVQIWAGGVLLCWESRLLKISKYPAEPIFGDHSCL